jgi:hypothetical protein
MQKAIREKSEIRINGQTWFVPRGFGLAYARAAKQDLALVGAGKPGQVIGTVVDLLALIGYAATNDQVACWDLRRRVEAVVYASTVHARASDNPVRRHPRPAWLPARAWRGPNVGDGVWAGPGGTPIPGGTP